MDFMKVDVVNELQNKEFQITGYINNKVKPYYIIQVTLSDLSQKVFKWIMKSWDFPLWREKFGDDPRFYVTQYGVLSVGRTKRNLVKVVGIPKV